VQQCVAVRAAMCGSARSGVSQYVAVLLWQYVAVRTVVCTQCARQCASVRLVVCGLCRDLLEICGKIAQSIINMLLTPRTILYGRGGPFFSNCPATITGASTGIVQIVFTWPVPPGLGLVERETCPVVYDYSFQSASASTGIIGQIISKTTQST
jgi:hypothetical protein